MLATLWLHWFYAGHVDVRNWLERTLAGVDSADEPLQFHLLIALAVKVEEDGDGPRAVELARQALGFAERLEDPDAVALGRAILGIRLLRTGQRDEAQRLLERALAARGAEGAPAAVGFAHHDLGWIAMAEGDAGRAKEHFEQGLEAVQEQPDGTSLRVHCLAALAPVAALTGEPERARTLATEAVAQARLLNLRRVLVMALVRGAETAVLTGDREPARDLVRELLALLAEIGSRGWVADSVELAALVLGQAGQLQPAARLMGACAAIRAARGESAGDLRPVAGTVQAVRRQLSEALGVERFGEQEALGAGVPMDRAISYALEWLG